MDGAVKNFRSKIFWKKMEKKKNFVPRFCEKSGTKIFKSLQVPRFLGKKRKKNNFRSKIL